MVCQHVAELLLAAVGVVSCNVVRCAVCRPVWCAVWCVA